jgi:hypothetical protein
MLLVHGGLGLVQICKNAGAALIETAARIGQVNAPRRTLQQLHTQPALEGCYATACGRCRYAQAVRSGSKGTRLYDGNKGSQIFKSLHIIAFLRIILCLLCCLFFFPQ